MGHTKKISKKTTHDLGPNENVKSDVGLLGR
jgi:hypothetical protein